LKNHLEELKLLQASLGKYTYALSCEMQQKYMFKNTLKEFGEHLEEAEKYY
jgi:hypothetical protein